MTRLCFALILLTSNLCSASAAFVVKRVYPGAVALPSLRAAAETPVGVDMDGDPASGEAFFVWYDFSGFGQVRGGIIHLASGLVEEVDISGYGYEPGDPRYWGTQSIRPPDYVDVDGDGRLDALLTVGEFGNPNNPTRTVAIGWDAGLAVPSIEPTKRNLPQARPNPSSSGAQVEFQLLAPGQVSLQIFDLGGRRVRELTAPFSTAGRQFFRWDGHDDAGRAVPSGNYFWLLSKVRVDWVPGRIVELGPHLQSKRS